MQAYFFIRTDRQYTRIDYAEVQYFESAANFIKIHTDTQLYMTYHSLRELEEKLPPSLFCRINRAVMVPIARIRSFDRRWVRLEGIEFPVTERGYQELEKRIPKIVSERSRLVKEGV